MKLLRWLDVPPVWMAGFAVLVWLQGHWNGPLDSGPGRWAMLPGWLLIGAGVGLAALAARELSRHRTTIIPHQTPGALVQSGIFGWTRNPIYLGDCLVLAGLAFLFHALLALPLVLVFGLLISRRFIRWEEARLIATFGPEAEAYMTRVRRWL